MIFLEYYFKIRNDLSKPMSKTLIILLAPLFPFPIKLLTNHIMVHDKFYAYGFIITSIINIEYFQMYIDPF